MHEGSFAERDMRPFNLDVAPAKAAPVYPCFLRLLRQRANENSARSWPPPTLLSSYAQSGVVRVGVSPSSPTTIDRQ